MSIYFIICKGFELIHALKGIGTLFLSQDLQKTVFIFLVLKVPFSGVFTPGDDFYQFAVAIEMPRICLKPE